MGDINITNHGTQAGKGDKPRAVKGEDYRKNFDKIFRAIKNENERKEEDNDSRNQG